ncbi:ECF transporter S component [Streptococcus dentiloxodontae]
MRRQETKHLALAAVLTAFGIIIPIIMPVKLIVEPASYTLASHVPLFLAIFISPVVAFFVGVGTAVGFLVSGFPTIIVFRALSHLIFAVIAAVYLKKRPQTLEKPVSTFVFAFWVNIIHGLAEFLVVTVLATTTLTAAYLWTLFSLVAVGSVIHGLIDFYIAYYIWFFLTKKAGFKI